MADLQEIQVGNQVYRFPADMGEDEIRAILKRENAQFNTPNRQNLAQNSLRNTTDDPNANLVNALRNKDPRSIKYGVGDQTTQQTTKNFDLKGLGQRLHNRDVYAGIGSAIGGAGAVVAGNLGPQAFTPEEIITVPAAMVGGEAVGENIYDTIEILRGKKKTPTVREAATTLGTDLLSAAKWTAGAMAVPGLGNMVKRGYSGGRESIEELYKAGKNLNIPLSIGEVTTKKLAAGYIKVAGVFPWLGSGFVRQTANTKKSLENINKDILDTLAPNASIADLGVDVFNAAKNTYKSFRNLSAKHYNNFKNLAGGLKNSKIIQLGNIKNYVRELEEKAVKYDIGGKKLETIQANTGDPILSFLETITKIKGSINPIQYRNLQREINKLMNKGVVEGWDIKRLREAKVALEKDFSVLLMPSNLSKADQIAFKAVAEAHKNANEFYSKGIKLFDQPVAKPFQRVDKNIFRAGFEKGGTLNADELLPKVLNLNSPQAIKDLKALIEPDLFKTTAKNWLDDIWRKAAESRISLDGKSTKLNFNPNILAKELGLVGKNEKIRSQSVRYLLEQAGIRYGRVKDLVKVSRNYENVAIPDVNSFVARRVILGGAGTIASLVTGNGPIFFLGIMAGKYGTRILSNPRKLEDAISILNPKSEQVVNWIKIGKMLDFIAEGPEITPKEKGVLLQMKQEAIDISKEINKNRLY